MAVFYVATTGSDAADGRSAGAAFATLDRAQAAMRASGGDDTTLVRGGTYHLAQTLVLTDQDNGSHFAAFGTETPVLSGGTALTGWTQGAGGIWTAALAQADLHQLTLNGIRQTEARFPNQVPDAPVTGGWLWANDPPAGVDARQQLSIDPADLTASHLAVGVQVHLFTNASWSSSTLTVTAVNAATGVVTFDQPADFALGAATRYFVQGAPVLLDQPGEWYFDPVSQLVHFRAPPGFDGSGVAASGNHTLIRLEGASDVGISGFTLSDGGTDGHNGDLTQAGITIQGGGNNAVTANSFVNLAQGVQITQGSHANIIDGNTFRHLLAGGVIADYGTSDTAITNNDLRWTGEEFVYSGAIALAESHGNLVSHNLIRDVPRFGISGSNFDPNNPSGANIIEYNTILHAMQQTADGGAIYTWSGSDRAHDGDIYRYNRIIDAGGLEPTDGGFRPGQEYSNGIYLDDFTSRAQVYGNMIEGSVRGGIYLHGGSFNAVHDNIVLGNQDIGIQFFEIGEAMVGNAVYRNIVEATTDPYGNTVELGRNFVSPGTLHDNFYWNPRGAAAHFSGVDFAAWQAQGYDTGSEVFTGPIFVDPVSGNWALRPGSLPLAQGFVGLPLAQMGVFDGGRIVLGAATADVLRGAAGADVIDGFAGNDRIYGGDGADDLTGGSGNDQFGAGAGNDLGYGGAGNDGMFGQSGTDRLHGDAGNDRLDGGDDNDILWGDGGADRLYGRAGADLLHGGLGADVFCFLAPSDSTNRAAQRDRIADFQGGSDRIDLHSIDANAALSGDQAFRPGLTATFDGAAGCLRVIWSGANTLLQGDLNGDKVPDFTITLSGHQQLGPADILL